MREEIAAAVVFLTRLVKKNQGLTQEQLDEFSDRLSTILVERFRDHWYRDSPTKGQGYRCIRINEAVARDPVLEEAATATGLRYEDLQLPPELTVWVDPSEVCCRFGETKGSWCTLFKDGDREADCASFVERVLKQPTGPGQARPLVTARSKTRSGSTSPPSAAYHYNHNHNNNLAKYGRPFQGKGRPLPPSGSPTFNYNNRGRKAPLGSPAKATLQHGYPSRAFSTSSSNSSLSSPSVRHDRYHWVRGADLVKA